MSCNRENVVWQSEDGTWNRGFFSYDYLGQDDEDFDPEWDVVYDFDSFFWGCGNLPTKDAAVNSWTGANPGVIEFIHYDAKNKETIAEIRKYDHMRKMLNDESYRNAYNKKVRADYLRQVRAEAKAFFERNSRPSWLKVRASFVDKNGETTNATDYLRVNSEGVFTVAGHKVYNSNTKRVSNNLRFICKANQTTIRYI